VTKRAWFSWALFGWLSALPVGSIGLNMSGNPFEYRRVLFVSGMDSQRHKTTQTVSWHGWRGHGRMYFVVVEQYACVIRNSLDNPFKPWVVVGNVRREHV
jgi:hypothetical protein